METRPLSSPLKDCIISESGVVISEMPFLEADQLSPEPPSYNYPLETSPETRIIKKHDITSESTDRMSKMDEDMAEEMYKQRMGHIANMLKSGSAQDAKTSASYTLETDTVPTVKVSLSNSPVKPSNEKVKKTLAMALEKSNNSLRCSAEMRIAQIYMNSNQIIKSLNKLKGQNTTTTPAVRNQPVRAKAATVNEKKPINKEEEEEVLEEILRLDKLLKEKAQSRASSIKSTPHKAKASLSKSFSTTKKPENVDQGLIKGISTSDLQKMVLNRTINPKQVQAKDKTQEIATLKHSYSHKNQTSKPEPKASVPGKGAMLLNKMDLVSKKTKPRVNLRIQTAAEKTDNKKTVTGTSGAQTTKKTTIKQNKLIPSSVRVR